MYSKKVIEHFTNPRNVGVIDNASGIGVVGNPKCGDIMKMYILIDDETKIIKDCKFKTFGCGAAIATSSVATEMIIGKTIYDALKITNKDIINELEWLPDIKIHCSLLATDAIKAALYDYSVKNNIKIEGLEKPNKNQCHLE